eukprot:365009-Chlamydomonas_euryale.AAC.14
MGGGGTPPPKLVTWAPVIRQPSAGTAGCMTGSLTFWLSDSHFCYTCAPAVIPDILNVIFDSPPPSDRPPAEHRRLIQLRNTT